jgi:hypothetical protein
MGIAECGLRNKKFRGEFYRFVLFVVGYFVIVSNLDSRRKATLRENHGNPS